MYVYEDKTHITSNKQVVSLMNLWKVYDLLSFLFRDIVITYYLENKVYSDKLK